MFNIFSQNSGIDALLSESKRMLEKSASQDLSIKQPTAALSPKVKEIFENLSGAIHNYKKRVEYDIMKYQLANEALHTGLWDMEVIGGDPVNPNNTFVWSDQFRRMLGFTNESDFPNKLNSWSDRLHPEDKERALNAFAAHLTDTTGKTSFDIKYRLKLKNGDYGYFRATGDTVRDDKGRPLRVAGLLLDLAEEKRMAELDKQFMEKFTGYTDIIGNITQLVESATRTQGLAKDSEEISIEGGKIIDRTAEEMIVIANSVSEASRVIGSLGEASQQISAVVQVIKDVADQTNLLALNAAIEAARAGEQGRGFAVVADEVRKLAERTSSSTNEISQMIGKIQEAANDSVNEMHRVVNQVQNGQALAEDAGERIRSIRDAVQKVTAAVTEISIALREQSAASNELVAQMSQRSTGI